MSKKHTVLSIDDDKFIHKIIARTLGDSYKLLFASNGTEGIKIAEEQQPDAIITDVEMPGLNGFETCDRLKTNPETQQIPVIFLSSRDNVRERMKGFEVGADDYLVKPFEADSLIAKMSVLLRYAAEHNNLREKIDEAQKTAFIAMTGSSELGQALQLIEHSYAATSHSVLAQQFFTYVAQMGLSCSLLFKLESGTHCLTAHGGVSPLESELMKLLSEQGRFHDFGYRTQINYASISLLIKNMPLEDMERYGRIKDLFPSILAAYDAKLRSLEIDNALRNQNMALNQSFQSINNTIGHLGTSFRANANASFNILKKMFDELTLKLPGMALEEDQEEYILTHLDKAINSARDISETGDSISTSFEQVVNKLHSLVKQQNELIEKSNKLYEEQYQQFTSNSGDASSDIELF